MTIQQATKNFKSLISKAIKESGIKGKNSVIRSSGPILNLHDAVKQQLIDCGVNPELIHPKLGSRKGELKLAGFLKAKHQDVCVAPDQDKVAEILEHGLQINTVDKFGFSYTEKTLCINVRSQISSIQKNFDTLFERTFSEAMNLHLRCPKMVLGEVYMIAVPEYDGKAMENCKVGFKKPSKSIVEKYIKSFQSINGRTDITRDEYKYEAIVLLIVDFSKRIPRIYNTKNELIAGGHLPENSTVDYESISWNTFSERILKVYSDRFGDDTIEN